MDEVGEMRKIYKAGDDQLAPSLIGSRGAVQAASSVITTWGRRRSGFVSEKGCKSSAVDVVGLAIAKRFHALRHFLLDFVRTCVGTLAPEIIHNLRRLVLPQVVHPRSVRG